MKILTVSEQLNVSSSFYVYFLYLYLREVHWVLGHPGNRPIPCGPEEKEKKYNYVFIHSVCHIKESVWNQFGWLCVHAKYKPRTIDPQLPAYCSQMSIVVLCPNPMGHAKKFNKKNNTMGKMMILGLYKVSFT